jgi:hypothetical protein
MQAAPLSVVRAAAVAGYQDKLAIAFTHFDSVKGANLPNPSAKRQHVLGAFRSALASLRTDIGASLVASLEATSEQRCFMLGWLDKSTDQLQPKVREQIEGLLGFFEAAIEPVPLPAAVPVYDPASLLFAVQSATADFHARWNARLGLSSMDGVWREHWSRVKALNRRIADGWDVEYDTLKPVADLFQRLIEAISQFLDEPLRWEGQASESEERDRAIDAIRRAVSSVLDTFVMERLVQDHLKNWVAAYTHRGTGSTFVRAREIRGIYEDAAPVLGIVITEHTRAFLNRIRRLVHAGIINGGGQLAHMETPMPSDLEEVVGADPELVAVRPAGTDGT